MKTLDEVIKNLEDGTEHLSAMLISRETWSDTLHYLQEYKAKMKVLEYKSKRYDEMCETIQKQGQEHEDRSKAEIARYQEAVRNCEAAELKYRQLTGELGKNLAELRNGDQRYPNILFRQEGMYCFVCGSRLDQDREE